MTFEQKTETYKRLFVPESVWPLFATHHFHDIGYEEGFEASKSFSSPEITIYKPSDDEDDHHFKYGEIRAMVKDGVLDNLIPNEDGAIGISANDERALLDFIEEAQIAWSRCVDRLQVNKIVETQTKRYSLKD